MQEIKISYPELKAISISIIDLVGKITGYDRLDIGMQTSINSDIGIDEDA